MKRRSRWVFSAWGSIPLRRRCAGCLLWWRPVSIPLTSCGEVGVGGRGADPLEFITQRREWKREDSRPRTAGIAQGSAVLDSKWTTNTNSWTRINSAGGSLWLRRREGERYCGIQPKCGVTVPQSLQRQLLAVDHSQTFCKKKLSRHQLQFTSLPTSWTKLQGLFIVVSYSCCLLSRWKSCLVLPYRSIIQKALLPFLFRLQSHSKSCWCIANELVAVRGEGHWLREKDASAAAVLADESAAVGVRPPWNWKKNFVQYCQYWEHSFNETVYLPTELVLHNSRSQIEAVEWRENVCLAYT